MKANDERKRAASSMASASDATRCVRLSSPVKGSCRDSFTSCSSWAWRSLLMRTMPCDARRLAVGAGEPAAGFLDPQHRRGCRGPHAIFDAIKRAFAAMRRRRMAQRVSPDRAHRLDQLGKLRAAGQRCGRDIRKNRGQRDCSRPSRRWRCPTQRPPGRVTREWPKPGEQRVSRSPRFGTQPDDSRPEE